MPLEERVEFGTANQEIFSDDAFSVPEGASIKRVNLACGQTKKEGFIGVDRVKTEAADIIHDLQVYPWPFADGEIYEFNCEHYVEHIPMEYIDGVDALVKFMEEVWRCLSPGGVISIIAPYYTSRGAWQDPTHRRAITDVTFHYFMKELMKDKLDHYTGKCNFKLLARTFVMNPAWDARAPEVQNQAREHYWNAVQEIRFLLRKIDL